MMEVCLVVGTAEIKKHLAARAEEVPWLRAALEACTLFWTIVRDTPYSPDSDRSCCGWGLQMTATCTKACPQQRAELKSPQPLQLSKAWRSLTRELGTECQLRELCDLIAAGVFETVTCSTRDGRCCNHCQQTAGSLSL